MEIRGNNKIKSNRFAKALAIIFLRKKTSENGKSNPFSATAYEARIIDIHK
jgi:hypothetical protein